MSSIKKLFQKKQSTPKNIVYSLKRIIKKNDELGIGSRYRISKRCALEWILDTYGYKMSLGELGRVVKSLRRKSWGYK